MPKNSVIGGLLLMALSPGVAALPEPQPAIAPGNGVTQGELEEQQGKNLLLEAQVQTARLRKQLAEAGTDSQADGGPVSPVSSLPAVPDGDDLRPPQQKEGRIVVQEVSGRGTALQAWLAFPDGRVSRVAVGSEVPGTGLTVKAISLSSVTLSDGRQLTFRGR
ncbi:type IV pilus biogenesis protein PilP [Salmonella enterica subsp. enterica serovar Virchow]|nr:type IV pilus biogenesis protein PilP [Salmonella enterica subsp. enterica serovar Virchow]